MRLRRRRQVGTPHHGRVELAEGLQRAWNNCLSSPCTHGLSTVVRSRCAELRSASGMAATSAAATSSGVVTGAPKQADVNITPVERSTNPVVAGLSYTGDLN